MIIDELRAAMNASRKNKDSLRTMVLSTLIGQMVASGVMKDGVKVVTDKVATAVLKKAKKDLDDNIEKGYGSIDGQSVERQIVEEFIPEPTPLMTEEETRVAINQARSEGITTIKDIMFYLKTWYEGRYDGKIASRIAQEN